MTSPRAHPYRWHLMLGTELLAILIEDDYDFPWIGVLVRAEPGLARLLPVFTDPKTWPDNDPAFHALVAEVDRRGDFRLTFDDGEEVSPFTLVNLNEKWANLRY